MLTKEQFSSEIVTWRKAAGLSQSEAARVLQMTSIDTLRAWEQKRHLPPSHVVFLVREFIANHSTVERIPQS